MRLAWLRARQRGIAIWSSVWLAVVVVFISQNLIRDKSFPAGARGSMLALARLSRCHPWSAGGYDPVPTEPHRARARRV